MDDGLHCVSRCQENITYGVQYSNIIGSPLRGSCIVVGSNPPLGKKLDPPLIMYAHLFTNFIPYKSIVTWYLSISSLTINNPHDRYVCPCLVPPPPPPSPNCVFVIVVIACSSYELIPEFMAMATQTHTCMQHTHNTHTTLCTNFIPYKSIMTRSYPQQCHMMYVPV